MDNTKYKAGDIVRIKSKEWYDKNKNKFGKVWTKSLSGEYNVCFDQDFVKYCGREAVIFSVEPENYTVIISRLKAGSIRDTTELFLLRPVTVS